MTENLSQQNNQQLKDKPITITNMKWIKWMIGYFLISIFCLAFLYYWFIIPNANIALMSADDINELDIESVVSDANDTSINDTSIENKDDDKLFMVRVQHRSLESCLDPICPNP